MRNENIPFRDAPRLEMKKKHNISCASFLCPVPDEKSGPVRPRLEFISGPSGG